MNIAAKIGVASTAVTFAFVGRFVLFDKAGETTGHVKKQTSTDKGSAAVDGSSSSSEPRQLLVVAGACLTLFRLPQNAAGSGGDDVCAQGTDLSGLLVLGRIALAAPPTAADVVRPGGSCADVVALLFGRHLSVVGFDARRRAFTTVALYELSNLAAAAATDGTDTDAAIVADDGVEADGGGPALVRVDPLRRCFACLLSRRYLLVVPIRSLAADGKDKAGGAAAAAQAHKAAASDDDDWGDADDSADTTTTAPQATESGGTAAAVQPALPFSSSSPRPVDGLAEFFAANTDVLGAPRCIDLHTVTGAAMGAGAGAGGSGSSTHVRNVRDFVFVATAAEPTLALLCEDAPTWAGRVNVVDYKTGERQSHFLTCSVVWATVAPSTLTAKGAAAAAVFAVTRGIPYNAQRLVTGAFGSSNSGSSLSSASMSSVLVIAANAVIYATSTTAIAAHINQHGADELACDRTRRVAAQAMHMPEHMTEATQALLADTTFDDAAAGLDGAGRLVVGCSTGLLCVLEAVTAGGQTIGLRCVPALVTPRLSCVVPLPPMVAAVTSAAPHDALLFLGSAVGDSMVVRIEADGAVAPAASGMVLRGLGPLVHVAVGDFSTPFAHVPPATAAVAAANGTETANGDAAASSGKNPYASAMTATVAPDAPQPYAPLQRTLASRSVVVAGGQGAAGHVTVLRPTVSPLVMFAQPADCVSLFTASYTPAATGTRTAAKRRRDEADATTTAPDATLVFLALPTSTLIYIVTDRLAQLPEASNPFDTASRTVWAGPLCPSPTAPKANGGSDDEALVPIVQVTETHMTVARRGEAASTLQLPFVGQTQGDENTNGTTATTTVRWAQPLAHSAMVAVLATDGTLLVVDTAGTAQRVVRIHLPEDGTEGQATFAAACDAAAVFASSPHSQAPFASLLAVHQPTGDLLLLDLAGILATTGTADGAFTAAVRARVPQFSHLPRTVVDGQCDDAALGVKAKVSQKALQQLPTVAEMLCIRPSQALDAALTVLTSAGETVVYAVDNAAGGLSLFKQAAALTDREYAEEKLESLEVRKARLGVSDDASSIQDVTRQYAARSIRLLPFSNAGCQGLDGVFVCGRRPALVTCASNRLVAKHVLTHSPVRGFCELAPRGSAAKFAMAAEGAILFAALDKAVDHRGEACTQRHAIGMTPHHVEYLPETHSCVVVGSTTVPFRPRRAPFDEELSTAIGEDGYSHAVRREEAVRQQPFVPANSGVPRPVTEQYTILLYNACPWRKLDAYTLCENEEVMGAASGTLVPEGDDGRVIVGDDKAPLAFTVAAVGTSFPLGEDVTCRGRLLLFKPVAPVAAGRQDVELSTLHIANCQGPVTAVSFVKHYVAATVGATVRLYAYNSRRNSLVTVTFLSGGNYIPRLLGFKDFLLMSDAFNSVSLAKLHGGDRSLYALAKHAREFETASLNVIYRGKDLGVFATDADGNALVLSYSALRDQEGNVVEGRLTEESDLRFSAPITATLRLRVPKPHMAEMSADTLLVYVTANGELGTIHPVSERAGRTLGRVAQRLCGAYEHPAGLHPVQFRAVLGTTPSKVVFPKSHMLDADLLADFLHMSHTERLHIATAAAVSVDGILNALCGLVEQVALTV